MNMLFPHTFAKRIFHSCLLIYNSKKERPINVHDVTISIFGIYTTDYHYRRYQHADIVKKLDIITMSGRELQQFGNQNIKKQIKIDRKNREEKWHFSDGDLRSSSSIFAAKLIAISQSSEKSRQNRETLRA